MTLAIEARDLTKRYGRRRALDGCSLTVPAGRVVGLVGPNGAGKSTLLALACGLLTPTSGEIEVLGNRPASSPDQLGRVGFVAQEASTYAGLTVADHLRLGAHLNPRWDTKLADRRLERLGLDLEQRAGRLSGGQRAQLTLTLSLAKRPELLLLDEPAASLDPLARREFLQSLMEHVVEQGTSVVLSSHLVTDLERVCDYLVLVARSKVELVGDVDELLGTHYRLSGRLCGADELPPGTEVVTESHTDRQSTFVVRSSAPVTGAGWTVDPLDLEDLALAYMRRAGDASPAHPRGGDDR
jgi:ABC-2 type transport system ATP-binding protein